MNRFGFHIYLHILKMYWAAMPAAPSRNRFGKARQAGSLGLVIPCFNWALAQNIA